MAMSTIAAAGYQPRKTRSLAALFRAFQDRFGVNARAHRDVNSLRNANDHILADLGLTRGQLARAMNAAPTFAGYDSIAVVSRAYRRHI